MVLVRKSFIFLAAVLVLTLLCSPALRAADNHQDKTILPVDAIQKIIGAEGEVSHGVLTIGIARKDIGNVLGPMGVVFTPSFQIHGDLHFQPLCFGKALLNGDMALKEDEVNSFISALIRNGLVFQAFHQHTPMKPQVWFVHFRGIGDPVMLAREIKAALNVTDTPFPQTRPKNPTTPLNPDRLATILHGDATVGEDGVVTVTVPRANPVFLACVLLRPEAGASTGIEFKPCGGDNASVVPDFAMISNEINPVVNLMLNSFGWFQGCLYNQETAEFPQLYFDHMVKKGNAYKLAMEIRKGLDLTISR
jgi:hypothetical protein